MEVEPHMGPGMKSTNLKISRFLITFLKLYLNIDSVFAYLLVCGPLWVWTPHRESLET